MLEDSFLNIDKVPAIFSHHQQGEVAMASKKTKNKSKKLLVLDTNVLMHDPTALMKFQEHDVFIPAIVIEELDKGKTYSDTVGFNSRQSSRFIDELFKQLDFDADIDEGIPLSLLSAVAVANNAESVAPTGLLYFQTKEVENSAGVFKKDTHDNEILSVALDLKNQKKNVVIVSKDINVRIKARALKIPAEDYKNDQTIEDIQLLYSGTEILPPDFTEVLASAISWKHETQTYYDIITPLAKKWRVNQFLYFENPEEKDEFVVLKKDGDKVQIRTIKNYREIEVFGIKALNREQNFALNAMLDLDTDFVTLAGQAGTGKTLLTLASALHLVLEAKKYDRIIFTREVIALGKEQGHLPGTEEAKLAPWLGALYDNVEFLTEKWEKQKGHTLTDEAMKKGKTGNPFLDSALSIKSLNYMQGRSLIRKILIIDEAQDITPKQMKQLITRAGPGTLVVCLGNLAQVASPYLSATSSGLAYVVDRFKPCEFAAHVTLAGVKRSRLAEFAANNL
jgi:PhoH-like ATPase